MAALINDLADSYTDAVLIITNSEGIDGTPQSLSWLPINETVVFWDPHMGLGCAANGGAQLSPALALGHELVHASQRPWKRLLFSLVPSRDYTNLGEQITVNTENDAAWNLGEGVRLNHGGTGVRVPTPLTKPDCSCQGASHAPPI
jgi:hypothetical protein